MRNGLLGSVSYGSINGCSLDTPLDLRRLRILSCNHNIVVRLVIYRRMYHKDRHHRRNPKWIHRPLIRPFRGADISIHKVALLREISLTSSNRPCHLFFQTQDHLRHSRDDLEGPDASQLHSRAMYMGVALPCNANSWILEPGYKLMRNLLNNPQQNLQ